MVTSERCCDEGGSADRQLRRHCAGEVRRRSDRAHHQVAALLQLRDAEGGALRRLLPALRTAFTGLTPEKRALEETRMELSRRLPEIQPALRSRGRSGSS
jgi:hypothetical protein